MKSLQNLDFKSPAVISLILVNGFLLILALFQDWRLYDIVFTYWLETIVIGFFAIFKMYKASGGTEDDNFRKIDDVMVEVDPIKTPFVLFFLLHFSAFTAIHGMFIQMSMNTSTIGDKYSKLAIDWSAVFDWAVCVGVAGLFISHGVSFFKNYIGKKEHDHTTFSREMWLPYKRILIIHGFIFGCAILFNNVHESHLIFISILIILKTTIDLTLYSKRHDSN
jgi:hypothetical protein